MAGGPASRGLGVGDGLMVGWFDDLMVGLR